MLTVSPHFCLEDIRRAIAEEQLVVHYQPIVDVTSRRAVSFEALVRWQKDDAVVAPDQFLPSAEYHGALIDIDQWVFKTACQQLSVWSSAGATCGLSINVCADLVMDSDFADFVLSELAERRLDASRLTVEITEHSMVECNRTVITSLERLRRAGVSVCIDDFGTGFAPLRYLQHFPVNVLKVDRSFTADLERSRTRCIVKTLIALARTLGLRVVAEGVENTQQLCTLLEFKCHFAQGAFFGMPSVADQCVTDLYAGIPA